METSESPYIIAIGASAGGMEEINSFFDKTPIDDASYVIIQHLSQNFKSRMVELLARHSKLTVQEAQNEMNLISNQVYLIPNDKFMTIKEGRFQFSEKNKTQVPHLTINTFFNSLAENSKNKAIAVILSGLGSDGAEGIKAIKKAGGMIMARNPDTTRFSSMPAKAVATGIVDFILEPEQMPAAIQDYITYETELAGYDTLEEKNCTAIIRLIKDRLPLDFSDYKQTTIQRRIKRRATAQGFTDLRNYLDFLKVNPSEMETLAKDFLISVTSFFRDKAAFESLQKNVFPQLLERAVPGEELKMWVAGCATGEEAYSLAIIITELLKEKATDTVVKIFATDLDSQALAVAGKAIYPADIERHVSKERLAAYFTQIGDTYKVNPEVRRMVIFAHHDMVKNPPYCNMQLITCRNLLIYMTPVLQKKIFSMLQFGLKTDGYLFLGSSESPTPILQNLEIVDKKWKIYRNLETKRSVNLDVVTMPEYHPIRHASGSLLPHPLTLNSNLNLADSVLENLVAKSGNLVVCIDEHKQVIKFYGDTTQFLLHKNFISNLEELLPQPLAIALNTMISAVSQTKEEVTVNGIKIKQGSGIKKVSLNVSSISRKKEDRPVFVITFTNDNAEIAADQDPIQYDEKIYLDQYSANLEEELKELKVRLNSAYEQLDASNENMQSFNEELISANEEMQSTNEEMQSVNEELDTINADYQLKNKELLEINDDLNNYFRSNISGQLFIDKDLHLMKFSPGALKQINLLDSDIGRPLSNISTNIKFENLIDDIKQVIAKGSVITKEIQTVDGKWYYMITMPYIQQSNNKQNGAVITFTDVSELKMVQVTLDKKNQSLLRINADLDHFVHTASHDLLGPLGNIEMSIGQMNQLKVKDPKLVQFIKIINSSILKFRALVMDIATIAKLENDTISTELIDLNELILDIQWSLNKEMKSSGAVIVTKLITEKVNFSKKNLRSILYNLISNGIKYRSESAPMLTISSSDGHELILSVQDNGVGIAKDDLKNVFTLYKRFHQNIEGHGIGLYLAKKIIDASGGNITVKSEVGKGSLFEIHFKEEVKDSGMVL